MRGSATGAGMTPCLRMLTEFSTRRRNWIPETIWWIIGIGTIITVGFMCFFGAPNFRMHLGMTAMVASSMALVIVLIVSLDRPFRGDLCVSLDAFQNVKDSIAILERAPDTPQ